MTPEQLAALKIILNLAERFIDEYDNESNEHDTQVAATFVIAEMIGKEEAK